jgi:hypothetical protein
MNRITDAIAAAAAPANRASAATAPTTLTQARFSDMYRSAIAAAVDRDGDGIVSAQEYAAQTGTADGPARVASFDIDGDGKVSQEEFAQGVDDPLATDRAAVIERLRHQIAAGMPTAQPQGRVLGADGRASDPDSMLRFLAHRFPGNVDV